MASGHVAPFGTLLSSAWQLFRARFHVLLPGIIVFVLLSLLVQLGIPKPSSEAVMIAISAGILSALVGIISYLYYLLAMTGKDASFGAILQKTFPLILPFIGLSLLTMLRTFMWIALVGGIVLAASVYNPTLAPIGGLLIVAGMICAIVFGPRFVLAPIIWVKQGVGVRAALQKSYDASAGYWGKIVGNCLLLTLIFVVIMMGIGIVAGILAAIGGDWVGLAVTNVLSHCYNALFVAFLLFLTEAILSHPRVGT